MLLGFLVFALVALVGVVRRLPLAYSAYAGVALLMTLSYPVDGQPLMSLPRYIAVLFPFQMWLALWAGEREGRLERVGRRERGAARAAGGAVRALGVRGVSAPPPRALLLDALGTLVELEPPVEPLRRELRERFGLEVSEAQARAALRAEIAFYRAHHDERVGPRAAGGSARGARRRRCATRCRAAARRVCRSRR